MAHRNVTLPSVFPFASQSTSSIGNYLASYTVLSSGLGGFYAAPLRTPPNLNRAYPVRCSIFISPSTNSIQAGSFVVLPFAIDRQTPGYARVEYTITSTIPIPNPWNTTDLLKVLIDNGNGWTLDPDVLDPGTLLGFRVARDGAAPGDTFNQSLRIAASVDVEYLPLFPWDGC
jgi:hypothetical protein